MVELTSNAGTAITMGFAGDTYNTAVYLQRLLGADAVVQYLTATGDDWLSELQREAIAEEHLTLEAPRVRGTSPGLYLVRNDADGERSFTYYRDASPARTMFDHEWDTSISDRLLGADLIMFSAITLQILSPRGRAGLCNLLDRARATGSTIAFDTNYRPAGWSDPTVARTTIDTAATRADIVLPSLEDERQLGSHAESALDIGRRYLALGAREVVITDGPSAITVVTADETHQIRTDADPAPVDTTGAGDSFDAGYIAVRVQNGDVTRAVAEGQALAARVIRHHGAILPAQSTT